VEATLPSGDIASDEVEIFEAEDTSLNLHSDQSPHEWLSWQQLVGTVKQLGTYNLPTYLDFGFDPHPGLRTVAYWVANPVPAMDGVMSTQGEAWTHLASVIGGGGGNVASQLSHTSPEPVTVPSMSDPISDLLEFTGEGPKHVWESPLPWQGQSPLPRRYLIVESETVTHLICMPVPWYSYSDGLDVPAQVLVKRQTGRERPELSVTVRDPLIGSALGYMAVGALPTAALLYDTALSILFDKVTNPLAAAGGGYVLLGTEHKGEEKVWHSWIENLMNWFEWLPDGAIQHGWLKVRHRQSTSDLDEARQAFFTAYNRGLPFYSVGLQWLADGLAIFASSDPEAARMLDDVTRVARQTNMQSPFTIVRLPIL
jgi:hypothetical protein